MDDADLGIFDGLGCSLPNPVSLTNGSEYVIDLGHSEHESHKVPAWIGSVGFNGPENFGSSYAPQVIDPNPTSLSIDWLTS